MISIEHIKSVLDNSQLKEFLVANEFNNSLDKKMIGVTLSKNEDYIIKFYLELKRDSNLNTISAFRKYFDKLKPKIDFKTPTSFATGFKINNRSKFNYYIHFKFGRNIILKPKSSKLKFVGTKNCKFGLSIEKNSKTKILKRYFYFFNKEDKLLIAKLFNLNINVEEVDHFEIYETKDNVKVNIIYDFYKNDISFLKENNLDYFSTNVNVFSKFFKKTPKYFGIDKKENLSFYYSFTKTKINIPYINPLKKEIKLSKKKYSVEELINISLNYPLSCIPTSRVINLIQIDTKFLLDNLKNNTLCLKDRAMKTDLSYPILLTYTNNKLQFLDGMNRVYKAFLTAQDSVLCRVIPHEAL